MGILANLFTKKDQPVRSYQDFWKWFLIHEKTFFNVIKEHRNIEREFFNKISPKLNELQEGYFYLTGMLDDNTAELILTADGTVKNIVFVEELVSAAPLITNWKFTALKPSTDIKNVGIELAGYKFNSETLFFFSNDNSRYPDEIDITILHTDYTENNKNDIANGACIFLDNYLGELNFVTIVDNLTFASKNGAENALVPIEKLKDFLTWRQKEFIEKYEGTRRDTANDTYSAMEGALENGKPIVAVINAELLNWDSSASHPWVVALEIKFAGNENGMPDQDMYQLLNAVEEKAMAQMKDADGYLNIGRETADNTRSVYFACKEFRKPSRIMRQIQTEYTSQIEVNFDIYKDKYWRTFNRFKKAN